MEFIRVPGGTFLMGSTMDELEQTERQWQARLLQPSYRSVFRSWLMKEYPAHPVRVDAFRMARFPVRNDEYQEFLSATGSARAPELPESLERGLPGNHPVWGVRLSEAQAFLGWCSSRDRLPWRLPTEAEWEWASGGPKGLRYPFGDEFDASRCNTAESASGTSCPVDAHPDGASFWGIEDLAGNVEEWTGSVYMPYPGGEVVEDDLLRILGPKYPVLRGGSFALGGDLARTRRRHGPHPGVPFRVTGFRMVVSEDSI
ncbi:TRP-2 [Burkholderia pseudomallei]|uniref:formylglycine-generating enzyme family protein n=1 Tax=Burkholderia pseudomallei TaxID=28450 RepID=UPI000F061903|nr:SUMF1/EgtB/PvdO family nonheme iron enzyme [Burkholderia pseudomallei]VBY40154.1 TRP-2 [Burkholderia pseudomallei]VBY63061.1 TRP-2 [Burkholderia pseudomallei]VBY77256.1 TRP-2 [Burkholderia pseudomallei]VBY88186.1 TRP-2 [Burkholderia pseudomallei]